MQGSFELEDDVDELAAGVAEVDVAGSDVGSSVMVGIVEDDAASELELGTGAT